MCKKKNALSSRLLMLLVGLLAACNLPSMASPTPTSPPALPSDALLTAAAGTAVAALTARVPTSLPPTHVATATITLTPSPMPSATPTATFTPTPSSPMLSVSVNTNCRTGPGKLYPRVGALLVGKTVPVIARDPSGQFWYIPNPTHPGTYCWVWGQYAKVVGDLSHIVVFTPIPLPPDARLEFVGATQCMDGVHIAFKVTNTGGLTWQSYVANYDDLTAPNGFTSFQTFKFYDDPGCVDSSHQVIDDLAPGESGYIQYTLTGSLIAPGNHIRFTVRLFENDGPGGQSIQRQVEFTFPTP